MEYSKAMISIGWSDTNSCFTLYAILLPYNIDIVDISSQRSHKFWSKKQETVTWDHPMFKALLIMSRALIRILILGEEGQG